ncbi:MAG: transcription antitermination factor NusB [Gammaproteobacteria bacterium]|nr:transcription antitermination factor NusB [Gammaproteobacteria bacterium]
MKSSRRHQARSLALQALYQWQLSRESLPEVENHIASNPEFTKKGQGVDMPYFRQLFHSIPQCLDKIDAVLTPAVDRPLSQLDLLEFFILRIGAYELLEGQVPPHTVIDEAVELAKSFAGADSYKYINAVLDKVKKNQYG